MNFATALPRSSKGHNAIWVIIDRLTKSAHFIPFRVGQSTEISAERYMQEIVRLHGVPVSIVLDRDTRFLSHFWQSLQASLESKLKFSTAYHPQTDGQSEILYKFWKTCYEPVLWISRGPGKITCIWLNSPIITATKLVFRCHHLKLYMDENVDHPCVGMTL